MRKKTTDTSYNATKRHKDRSASLVIFSPNVDVTDKKEKEETQKRTAVAWKASVP